MKLFLPLLLAIILIFHSTSKDAPSLIGKGQMPAIALDVKGNVHLIYGSGDSLMYSVSNIKNLSFSSPELIGVIDGLAASATRGPKIVVSTKGLNIIAATEGGSIWSFTKNNRDKWIKGNRLNDADSVNLEGFADVASDGVSNLFAVWLDLRGNKRNKLYGARSSDGGKSWSGNIKIYESPDSTICECCRVSAAMKGNMVHIMFRNQLYGKRDMYLITSIDKGRTFGKAEKLGTGSWTLKGCPMDGGDLALAPDGKIQTVWRRESKIYSCEPGNREVEIGEGKSCTIANVNGKNAYAWVKNNEVVCRLPDGDIENLGKGNSPVLQNIGDNHVLCVWENEKQLYFSVIHLN